MQTSSCKSITVVIPAYQAEATIQRSLKSVLMQDASGLDHYEIIVVNDCSTDQTKAILDRTHDPRLRVIHLTENKGRSAARNMGAKEATSSHIIFIDSDCIFAERTCLQTYIQIFNDGYLVCFGAVTAKGPGFWYQYQKNNYEKRIRDNDFLGLSTSQNFGVHKSIFTMINGFDERYDHYGFEDRDLYLRIFESIAPYKFKQQPSLVVYHTEDLNLHSICRKMETAGRYSARIFRNEHPNEYNRMVYAKFDAHLISRLSRKLLQILLVGYDCFERLAHQLLESNWQPFRIKKFCVNIICALSYFRGTHQDWMAS